MHAMQSFFLTALATVATAHYVFPSVIEDGVATPPWADVRQYTTYYTNNPVTDVTSVDIRCNVGGSTISSNTTTVNAGDNIGFTVTPNIYHPGPAQAYMAKAPSSTNIATWDGSGDVWFKIFGQGPSSFAASGLTWPSMDASSVMFTIPKDLPTGDYLVRVEQIGLHVASTEGGAQFYLSCAQLHVENGGSGTPGPLVAFPGAYSPTDPGLLIDIYYPVPTNYTLPGPAVWTG